MMTSSSLAQSDPSLNGDNLRKRARSVGLDQLSDEDLIALLLTTGVSGGSAARLARELIAEVGSVQRLSRVGAHRLMLFPGIGPSKALRVLAGIELGRRLVLGSVTMAVNCGSEPACYEAIVQWARPRLVPLRHEEVWLLCLDSRNALRSTRRVAQGGRHGCALLPADVLRPAIEEAASAIVLVHNHPSGDPTPSHADRTMTRTLGEACEILGMVLMDHIVVAQQGSASLRQLGVL